MGIVLTAATMVFIEGHRYFRTNQAAADAQRNAMLALTLMTTELQNANARTAAVHPMGSGVTYPGIVFASSIDDSGRAYFHPVTGKIFWQKLICYYFDGEKIIRRWEPLPDEDPPNKGTTDISFVQSEISAKDSDYFAGSTLQFKILGTGFSAFNITEFDSTSQLSLEANAGVSVAASSGARQRAFDLLIEAGLKSLTDNDGYYIGVHSRVTPRG